MHPEGMNTGAMPDLLDKPLVREYLASVRDWHGYIRFLGLPNRRDNPDLIIDRLFVDPLLTHRHVSPEEDPELWGDRAQTAIEALTIGSPLIVLGDPGTGKSTLVNYLVWLLARPGRNALVDRLGWRLPLPMVLRELRIGGVTDFGGLIDAFLGHAMSKPLRDREYLNRALASGQAFIFLDGIDEVGDPAARADLRRAVFDGFDRYPDCRWMLTSRIVGYSDAPFDQHLSRRGLRGVAMVGRSLHDERIVTRFIAPFDNRRVEAFARRWYVQRVAGLTRAEKDAKDFVQAIRDDPAILQLARVPNLLTMMVLIHRVDATLPHGRALLYDRISEAYLESIDKFRQIHFAPVDLPTKKRWLARVAYEMQLRRTQQKHNDSPIIVDKQDVIRWLHRAMNEIASHIEISVAEKFLDYVSLRSGLFLPRGEAKYAFVHLSFQEYFAAVALEREVTGINWARGTLSPLGLNRQTISSWATREVWCETLVFLFELLSSKQDWHDELRNCIFGSGYSLVDQESKDRAPNLAMLLARLVINGQSGLPASEERPAITACVRTEFRHCPDRWWSSGRTSNAFFGLMSENSSLTREVLEIISKEADKLRIDEIVIWGTRITSLAPLARVTSLKRLNVMDTKISDLTALKTSRSLYSLDFGITAVADLMPLKNLERLRVLEFPETDVSDLSPLKQLRSLEKIDLRSTRVFDVTILANLRSLNAIELSDTKVSDITPLRVLSSLRELYLTATPVSDILPLAKLSSLRKLDLSETQVSDLGPLARMPSLAELHLCGTPVYDVSPLRDLSSLLELDLTGTKVFNLWPLARLPLLKHLYLTMTPISDLAPLTELVSLKVLVLRETRVTDLTPLTGLRSLERLAIPHIGSDSMIRKLRDALPGCDITVHTDSGLS